MNVTQVKEVCLYVDDLYKAECFYHDLLQFPVISKVLGRHIFFRVGTTVLLCFIPDVTKQENTLPPHWAYGQQHIAFEVDDYPTCKMELVSAGIRITHTQDWPNNKESAYFDDPFGHVLEIVPKGLWDYS